MTRKQRKVLYPILLLLGLGLIIWQIKIFRNTIIDLSIPIGIILVVGVISFILDSKNYVKTYDMSETGFNFFALMQGIIGYGFIAGSIFMLANFYLADKDIVTRSFEIMERSSLPGGENQREERTPTFTISYDGKIKELGFRHEFYETMDVYENVQLEVRKGYFGFDILESKRLN